MNGTDSYDAPPAYRPFSAMAIVAFVLALLCGIPAMLLLWWAEIPAALLGAIAWGATGPTGRRGRGLAIAATLIAILAGGGSFVVQRGTVTTIEAGLRPLVSGLLSNDRVELSKWAAEDDPKPDLDVWVRRAGAAKEALGAFTGTLEFGNVFWGPYAAIAIPSHGDEFEPKGEAAIGPFEAVWFRVVFEKGDAWIALRTGKPGARPEESMKEVGESLQKRSFHFVRDVRLFRGEGPAK